MKDNKCTGCGLSFPATVEYFSKRKAFRYNNYLSYRCKQCDKQRRDDYNKKHGEKAVAARKAYYDLNKDKIRSKVLLKNYGIDSEEYDGLLSSQNGVCAICRQPEMLKRRGKTAPLSVDHDHTTGKIRGLLCSRCNTGLGLFRDDTKLLKAATWYINVNRNM